jgi:hypothetical protein
MAYLQTKASENRNTGAGKKSLAGDALPIQVQSGTYSATLPVLQEFLY